MGMTSYDRLNGEAVQIPWPYTRGSGDIAADETITGDPSQQALSVVDPSRWYTFQQSDTYMRTISDYQQIQQSGDVNALLLFVAHHPYCTDALLQLGSVLRQTNHPHEAQQLLKRCLWVFECAAG